MLLDKVIHLTEDRVCDDWGACLEIEDVERLFAGRDSITLRDLLQEPVAPEDLLWLVLRPEIIPEYHLHELGCRYAEHVIEALGADPDPRIVSAIEAKRTWLAAIGTPQEAARKVALLAARPPAWAAAQVAAQEARVVAWGAVQAAAQGARAVAWGTAQAAAQQARVVAWEAARAAQVGTRRAAARKAREAMWEKLLKITTEYLKEVSDG